MQMLRKMIALAPMALLAGGAAFAQDLPPPAAPYRDVEGLQFRNGVWVANARDGAGDSMQILIAPVSGHVYAADEPSRLDKDAIESSLTAQGYQDLDDLDFDNGIWRSEARDSTVHYVDLIIDPTDGSVIASKRGRPRECSDLVVQGERDFAHGAAALHRQFHHRAGRLVTPLPP